MVRAVIGWSMSKRIKAALVCDALLMALRNKGFPQSVIIHCDRGTQYCSKQYLGSLIALCKWLTYDDSGALTFYGIALSNIEFLYHNE